MSKVGMPEWMLNVVFDLRDEYFKSHPEQDYDNMPEEEIEIASHAIEKYIKAYVDSHVPPVWKEYFHWYNDRSGDENELVDYNGHRLLDKDGWFVQEWHIDEQHRIVDTDGNQIFYSNGEPILAERMSDALVDFMIEDGLFWHLDEGEMPPEEDLWF